MIGPVPPPYGGQSILVQNILKSRIATRFQFRLLDIAHNLSGHPLRMVLTVRFLWRMLGLLRRFPEICLVHIHTSAGNALLEKGLYVSVGKLFRKKIVLHIHGGGFPQSWNRAGDVKKRIIRRILNACDAVIVLSRQGYCFFTQEIGLSSAVMVLPNAIEWRKENRKTSGEEVVFLYVGHLKPEKGLLDLLDAFRECRLLLSGRNISLRLMGGGDNEENERLIKREYVSAGMTGISFLGIRTGDDKWNEYASADVFLLPSHSEDMPISILEAMACGLPVIATSVGSIPEVIEDNVNGYLVAPHQPATLAAKMAQLVRDDDLRRSMGLANRDKVRREYFFEEYERKLENIYLALLAE
jgi:glycosyltransferase involved in cell wall biosynthesis